MQEVAIDDTIQDFRKSSEEPNYQTIMFLFTKHKDPIKRYIKQYQQKVNYKEIISSKSEYSDLDTVFSQNLLSEKLEFIADSDYLDTYDA